MRPPNPLSFPTDNRQFILLPANARRNYAQLLEKQTEINQLSEQSAYNRIRPGVDKSLGIVAAGVGINYLAEATAETGLDHPVLELGQYPLPRKMLGELAAHCSRILVIEEGAPFIEEALVGVLSGGIEVIGRLTGLLPRTGELSPDFVAKALGRDVPAVYTIPECVAPRPPGMCKGCPHSDSYNFITEALAGIDGARVFSDIGCYTLGALPPYNAIHSCVDMGASITMAKGAADAGVRPSIAVIGDSTFMHSGLTGLLDAIVEKTPLTLIILDNDAVAMTGAQESHGTGRIERIVLGLGVDREHVRVVTPLRKGHAENVAVLQEELAYEGVSVIISERECIQAIRKDP